MIQNRIALYVILCFSLFIVSEFSKYVLDLNTLIYNNLAENLTAEQLDKFFAQTRKWQYIGYIALPILIFIKTQVIAGVLDIGAFLFGKKIKHKTLWSIALKAEFVFLGVGILKIVWFSFSQGNYTLEDVQFFYPLSMLSMVGHENLATWFVYPLQVLNVFEIVYWIVLALLIDRALQAGTKENPGIKIVASSYGPALLIWVVTVMFFTLNIS